MGDLCIQNAQCHAIAYPGCYLLSADAVTRAGSQGATSNSTGEATYVYMKRYEEDVLEGILGAPSAPAFKGDGGPVEEALLNKPIDRVVDSKGNVNILDVGNQRIRQISNRHTDCLHSYRDEVVSTYREAVDEYEKTTEKVLQACRNAAQSLDDPTGTGMATLFDALVQETKYANKSQALIINSFCIFSNNPMNSESKTFYRSFTRNTFVLCDACDGRAPRPSVCPWPSLCACQAATRSLWDTDVFREC